MHQRRLIALDKNRLIPVAHKKGVQLGVGDARQNGRIGNLVAIQMQDRQNRPVMHRAEKLVGMPRSGQRPCLGLAIAHHASHNQVGVVKGGAVSMRQRITQLATFMD